MERQLLRGVLRSPTESRNLLPGSLRLRQALGERKGGALLLMARIRAELDHRSDSRQPEVQRSARDVPVY
eukprot:3836924-Rhodomonas_salina.1